MALPLQSVMVVRELWWLAAQTAKSKHFKLSYSPLKCQRLVSQLWSFLSPHQWWWKNVPLAFWAVCTGFDATGGLPLGDDAADHSFKWPYWACCHGLLGNCPFGPFSFSPLLPLPSRKSYCWSLTSMASGQLFSRAIVVTTMEPSWIHSLSMEDVAEFQKAKLLPCYVSQRYPPLTRCQKQGNWALKHLKEYDWPYPLCSVGEWSCTGNAPQQGKSVC